MSRLHFNLPTGNLSAMQRSHAPSPGPLFLGINTGSTYDAGLAHAGAEALAAFGAKEIAAFLPVLKRADRTP